MNVKPDRMRAALRAPSDKVRLHLLYGPDDSGAADLARQLDRAVGDGAERIDLDGATLRANPGRLADEAASLSLFGGARFLRVVGMGEESLEAVALLLAAVRAGNPVVALAPSLKASGKLVKLAAASPLALVCACYPPEGADADRMATGIAQEHGLRLAGGLAHRLIAAAGNDRAVLEREIEKLALYLDAAPERPQDLDDAAVDAVGADLGDSGIARAVDAAIDGRTGDAGAELARLEAAGISAIPLLRQFVRRLIALAEMRAEIDAGAAVDAVVERHRVFFRERPATMRALRRWTAPRLADALARARIAERAMMASGTSGAVLAGAELVTIARMAARLG